MHNAAFDAVGLSDWRYVKLPVSAELFEETVRALPASGYAGANVTIPHKLLALEVADQATDAARGSGAANTLTFRDGAIHADNTDVGGLLDALEDAPATALVLGAGGAGRGAVWALREAGTQVTVWNRTPERAAQLADELGANVAEAVDPGAYELLVNATAVGLDPRLSDASALAVLGLEDRRPPAIVADLVYRASGEPTPVATWATGGGARLIDGLELLVRQGARSFEVWTGKQAPLAVMRLAVQQG